MKTTGNYGLKKPEGTDVVNIDDLNANADLIDAGMKKNGDGLNVLKAVRTATLTVAGWSAVYPYTQTVSVAGMTAADNPVLVKALIGTETEVVIEAYNEAIGLIFGGDTGSGTATFRAMKKPAVNITIGLKGV